MTFDELQIHTLWLDPWLWLLDDAYLPESAGELLRGLKGLPSDAGKVSVQLWAMDAEIEMEGSRN